MAVRYNEKYSDTSTGICQCTCPLQTYVFEFLHKTKKKIHTSINRCSKSKILIVFRYHKLSTCCKAAVHNYSFKISWASQCSVLAYSLWQTVFSSQSYKHLFNVISKLDTPCKYLHFITPPQKVSSYFWFTCPSWPLLGYFPPPFVYVTVKQPSVWERYYY